MSKSPAREKGRERGKQMGLSYAGALTPQEAYEIWREIPGAKLVDVRTSAEFEWVGRIPGAVEIEWITYPTGSLNPDFIKQLEQHVPRESPLVFICRSGVRSHHAAVLATQQGYAECYNVLEGFEGDKDSSGHRNTAAGWRHAGLPWKQS